MDARIKECFDFLYLNQRHLTASQTEFVAGCKRHYSRNKELSERQISALNEIRKYLNAPETVRYGNSK